MPPKKTTPPTPNPTPSDSPGGPTDKTPRRTRKPSWWEPFEAEIIEYCIKPRLYELLQIGVDSKQDLLAQWNEATSTSVPMTQMDRWLEASGLSNVFQETKKFRIDAPRPIYGAPAVEYTPPPAPTPVTLPGQEFGLPPQGPAGGVGPMRRPIPRIPGHDPDEQALMAAGVTPIVPGMSRRPGNPPGRTSLNHGGQSVPLDFFQ